MAENKKSFVLYSDLIHTVRKLPKEKAGELFMHILSYVNDENPTTDDLLIEVAFEQIKQQLKRDLQKYEEKRKKLAEAGRKGGLKSGETRSKDNQDEANEANASNNEANEAVNVNDNVNVTDNVNEINNNIDSGTTDVVKPKSFKALTDTEFYKQLKPFVNTYDSKMIRAFYDYWTEPNANGKMRFQLEKTWDSARRLKTWSNNENKFGPKQPIVKTQTTKIAGPWDS